MSATRIRLRRDTTANWEANNPILAQGEVGVDITNNNMKIGNGSDVWTDLEYVSQAAMQNLDGGHGDTIHAISDIVLEGGNAEWQ